MLSFLSLSLTEGNVAIRDVTEKFWVPSHIAPFGFHCTHILGSYFSSVLGLTAVNQTHFPDQGVKMSYKDNQRALPVTEAQPVHSVLHQRSFCSVQTPNWFSNELNQHRAYCIPSLWQCFFLFVSCVLFCPILGVEMSPPLAAHLGA